MAERDLTQGKPLKEIVIFTIPLLFGNVFQQLYSFFDTLIVGRTLGLKALAGVGATGPMIFFIIGFLFAYTQGLTIITAQRFGAKDYEGVRKSFTTSIILCIITTLLFTAITVPLVRPVLTVMHTPADIFNQAYIYMFISYLGLGTILFYNLLSNVIRALGDSKTPLYFLIIASVLNIILDLYFILSLHWGVGGAAIATVLSQGVSAILCAFYMFKKFPILKLKKSDWKFDKSFAMEHLKIGFPMGIQMSVLTIGIIAVQFALNTLGSTAIAAFTTAVRIDQLFSQSLITLGATAATFTAQNFGAGKLKRIKEGSKASMLLVLIMSAIAAILICGLGETLVGLFLDKPDEQVVSLAMQYLHIIVIFYFFLGTLILYRNVLQGMGKVKAPLISGLAELVARTAAAFILCAYMGYLGVCLATPLAWIFAAIVLFAGYRMALRKAVKSIRKIRHTAVSF